MDVTSDVSEEENSFGKENSVWQLFPRKPAVHFAVTQWAAQLLYCGG